MKKVFAILAVASFVTFTSCGNAAKQCDAVVDEVEVFDFEDGEEIEEEVEEVE
jgi:hypothetical protein